MVNAFLCDSVCLTEEVFTTCLSDREHWAYEGAKER